MKSGMARMSMDPWISTVHGAHAELEFRLVMIKGHSDWFDGSVRWWRSNRSTLTRISASHQSFWPLFLLNEPPRDSSSLIPRYWLCSVRPKFHKNILSRFRELLWFWIIYRTCHSKKKSFSNFLKLFILDNARKLHFIIIWMQEFNNFICQGMGKILSKTRSNWLSCLAWNFVMSHNLCVIVMSYFDSFYFCTNHTRYFIFDI